MNPSSSSSSSSSMVPSSRSGAASGGGAGASATGWGTGSGSSICFTSFSPVLGSTSSPASSTIIGLISSSGTDGLTPPAGFIPPFFRSSAVDIPSGSFAFAAASAPRPEGATAPASGPASGPGPPVNFRLAERFPCSSQARNRSRSFASCAAVRAASALAASLRRAASSAAATFARSASASLATDLASADPGLYSPCGSAMRSKRSSLSSSDLRSTTCTLSRRTSSASRLAPIWSMNASRSSSAAAFAGTPPVVSFSLSRRFAASPRPSSSRIAASATCLFSHSVAAVSTVSGCLVPPGRPPFAVVSPRSAARLSALAFSFFRRRSLAASVRS
mmetsp:Transcript_5245/g.23582  ORF Transcript_5245/g.23582 Transcript_5245/m.23582 type:complete len:333 (+) Transcript_5245:1487-2485(+)